MKIASLSTLLLASWSHAFVQYQGIRRPLGFAPRAATMEDVSTQQATVNAEAPTIVANKAPEGPHDKSPGLEENEKFVCDEYVEFWRNFQAPAVEETPQKLLDIIAPYLQSGSTQARAYWIYHMIRCGYFTGTAAAGVVAHVLYERFIQRSQTIASTFADGTIGPRAALLLMEAFISYEQNYKWVEKGILNYPWDATIVASAESSAFRLQLDHKQSNPLFALSETTRLMRESIGVWGRRVRLAGKPRGVWLGNENAFSSDVQYPSYYLNDFHYQTDGWLSSESAASYDVSTETLFLGRQDSMQRQTLVPLKKHFGKQPPKSILEVACGTGRYATFARDNFPTSDMTLVDLSPFYLEKARESIKYWEDYRGETAMKVATGKETSAPKTTKFIQANAEKLPFPDNSFDAVTTVYLFHELPHEARVNAAKELARVCKPGGMVVFSDSLQRGDRPPLDEAISSFSYLNEPHYESYLLEDIPALFEKHGLKCSEKYMNSRTKTLSFVKES